MSGRALFGSIAIAAVGIGLVTARPLAQQNQETAIFRGGVQLIEVDVRVTDGSGSAVRDLTKEDFTLLEDGVPQTIAFASFMDLGVESPMTRVPPGAPESDVATNAGVGRTWVMLLGNLGEHARIAARMFVEQALGPNDQMAVISVHGTMSSAQGFTRQRSVLFNAIDRLGESAADTSLSHQGIAYRVLEQLCMRLARVSGRKAVVFFDPPAFFAPEGPQNNVPGVRTVVNFDTQVYFDQRDAIRAATRNNVTIYVVSSLGVRGTNPERFDPAKGVGGGLKALAGQRLLAEETGGDAIVNTNNYLEGYQRFVRDSSQYYLLAYTPTVEHRDGALHRITVRVNRSGLRVLARSGYYAPEAAAPPRRQLDTAPDVATSGLSTAALEALSMPLSVSGITVDMFAAPFRGPNGNAIVWVGAQLRPDGLLLDRGELLELGFVGTNSEGKISPGTFHIARLDLTDRSRDIVESAGLPFIDRLSMAPGRHQVKFVAHQPNGRTGMVVADVDVPNFAAVPLSMSGLVLAATPPSPQAVIRRDEAVQKLLLSAYPTAVRAFSRNDQITAYVEVYTDAQTRVRETVAKITRLDQGRPREFEMTPLAETPDRWVYRRNFALRDFQRGEYVLTFESRAGRHTATRSVLFRISDR